MSQNPDISPEALALIINEMASIGRGCLLKKRIKGFSSRHLPDDVFSIGGIIQGELFDFTVPLAYWDKFQIPEAVVPHK